MASSGVVVAVTVGGGVSVPGTRAGASVGVTTSVGVGVIVGVGAPVVRSSAGSSARSGTSARPGAEVSTTWYVGSLSARGWKPPVIAGALLFTGSR